MKTLFITIFISLWTLTATAQPRIEFKQTEIDYGEIEKGADGLRVFKFTNTGDAPLMIDSVYSSCGCTIVNKPKYAIEPNAVGEISVKYDTKRLGYIRKTITVNSNGIPATIALKIKGKVVSKLSATKKKGAQIQKTIQPQNP